MNDADGTSSTALAQCPAVSRRSGAMTVAVQLLTLLPSSITNIPTLRAVFRISVSTASPPVRQAASCQLGGSVPETGGGPPPHLPSGAQVKLPKGGVVRKRSAIVPLP